MQINRLQKDEALTRDEIAGVARSVYGNTKHARTSDKYQFIPTETIMDDLKAEGWVPFGVQSVVARKVEDQLTSKHLLRFRNDNDLKVVIDKDVVVPEIVITNSHDGRNAFRAHMGIFRMVCANGLIAADPRTEESLRVTHKGYSREMILNMIKTLIDHFSQKVEDIKTYKTIELKPQIALDMAEKAIGIRWRYEYDRPQGLTPELVLQTRRTEDHSNDLWTTYNVIEENLMKGGIQATNDNGRVISTRPMKNVREQVRIEKSLWELMAETAEAVA